MPDHLSQLPVIYSLLLGSVPVAHAQAEIIVQDDGNLSFSLAILVFFAGLLFWGFIFSIRKK